MLWVFPLLLPLVAPASGSECDLGASDVLFLMHSRFDLSNDGFDRMKEFIKSFVETLDIGRTEKQSRAGVLTFDNINEPEYKIRRDSYGRISDVQIAVDRLTKTACGLGWCNTDPTKTTYQAVDTAINIFSNSTYSNRMKKIVILRYGKADQQETSLIQSRVAQDPWLKIVEIVVHTGQADANDPYYNYLQAYYQPYERYLGRIKQMYPNSSLPQYQQQLSNEHFQLPYAKQVQDGVIILQGYEHLTTINQEVCSNIFSCRPCTDQQSEFNTFASPATEVPMSNSEDASNQFAPVPPSSHTNSGSANTESNNSNQSELPSSSKRKENDYEYEIEADPPGLVVNPNPAKKTKKETEDDDYLNESLNEEQFQKRVVRRRIIRRQKRNTQYYAQSQSQCTCSPVSYDAPPSGCGVSQEGCGAPSGVAAGSYAQYQPYQNTPCTTPSCGAAYPSYDSYHHGYPYYYSLYCGYPGGCRPYRPYTSCSGGSCGYPQTPCSGGACEYPAPPPCSGGSCGFPSPSPCGPSGCGGGGDPRGPPSPAPPGWFPQLQAYPITPQSKSESFTLAPFGLPLPSVKLPAPPPVPNPSDGGFLDTIFKKTEATTRAQTFESASQLATEDPYQQQMVEVSQNEDVKEVEQSLKEVLANGSRKRAIMERTRDEIKPLPADSKQLFLPLLDAFKPKPPTSIGEFLANLVSAKSYQDYLEGGEYPSKQNSKKSKNVNTSEQPEVEESDIASTTKKSSAVRTTSSTTRTTTLAMDSDQELTLDLPETDGEGKPKEVEVSLSLDDEPVTESEELVAITDSNKESKIKLNPPTRKHFRHSRDLEEKMTRQHLMKLGKDIQRRTKRYTRPIIQMNNIRRRHHLYGSATFDGSRSMDACNLRGLDLVVYIDDSAAMNFTQFEEAKSLLKDLYNNFETDRRKCEMLSRLAILKNGKDGDIQAVVHLDNFIDKNSKSSVIDSLLYSGCNLRNPKCAMGMTNAYIMATTLLTQEESDRKKVNVLQQYSRSFRISKAKHKGKILNKEKDNVETSKKITVGEAKSFAEKNGVQVNILGVGDVGAEMLPVMSSLPTSTGNKLDFEEMILKICDQLGQTKDEIIMKKSYCPWSQ